MKLTLRTDIFCPSCNKEIEPESGFFASFIVVGAIKRLKNEGGIITCGNCNHKFEYKAKK